MRFKKLVAPILALSLLQMLTFSQIDAQSSKKIHVTVGNKEVRFTNDPIIENGHTLVEFRPIFEALGLKIVWDSVEQQVIGEKKGLQIILTIGSDTAIVNGHEKQLDVAPQIVNGRTIIPIRFVGESSGEKVTWNGDTETVSITGNLANDNYNLPIFINGQQLFNQGITPVIFNNSLYVSWMTINNIFGSNSTQYDKNSDTIKVSYNSNDVVIGIDRNNIDNTKVIIYNNSTCFPLQLVVEGVGGTYTEDSTGIHITLPQN